MLRPCINRDSSGAREGCAILFLAIAAAACHHAGPDQREKFAFIRMDATEYSVQFSGAIYSAVIGYTYVNRTGAVVSANYCRVPGPPALEKDVGSRWVTAFNPVHLLCLTNPPFHVEAGGSYRGVLRFAAALPGRNIMPILAVDSIPGTYRLRWVLRAGPDPDNANAALMTAVSDPFRLVVR